MNTVTKNNYKTFTYTNEELLKDKPVAIIHEFHGLNGGLSLVREHYPLAHFFAEHNIIYTMPCYGPWSWMNRASVNLIDEITEALWDKYGYEIPTISTGLSMGGLAGLIYSLKSRHTPIACAVISPVCDLEYHFSEREDTPRSIYTAFGGYGIPLMDAIRENSPFHEAESMPKIPYKIFSGTADEEVNYEAHSVKFVNRMKELGHNIELMLIPDHPHCDIGGEGVERYKEFLVQSAKCKVQS